MSHDFTGKVVLVTGSSSGIGEDLVIQFSKRGAKVVVTGRTEKAAEEVAQLCLQSSPAGLKPLKVIADLENRDDIERLVEMTISTFGQLDILVNNAGIYGSSKITEDDFMDVFEKVWTTDVRAILILTKRCVPHLIKTKGSIINVSSIASTKPNYGIPYCTSKASVDMITKCLSVELSPMGIRVNSINPISQKVSHVDDLEEQLIQTYPIRRIGNTDDTSLAVMFLASNDASFITGINLPVDGGFLNA